MELYLTVFVNTGDCVGKLSQAHTHKYWTILFICGPKNAKPGVAESVFWRMCEKSLTNGSKIWPDRKNEFLCCIV